jgi:hypothetical protein
VWENEVSLKSDKLCELEVNAAVWEVSFEKGRLT